MSDAAAPVPPAPAPAADPGSAPAAAARGKLLSFPKRPSRTAQELAFLPAALEIVETAASPTARWLMLAICLMTGFAISWAWFGHVDIVATAPGKIVASGRSKLVQPLESGIVRAIRVEEGQTITAGQVLIELDPTASSADRARTASELVAAELDIARLRGLVDAVQGGATPRLAAPAGAEPRALTVAQNLMTTQLAEHRNKLAALDGTYEQRLAEKRTALAAIAKLEATMPVLRQRTDMRKELAEKEYGSRMAYLELAEQLIGTEHELSIQRSRLKETEAALAAAAETRFGTEAEFSRGLLTDLTAAQVKADGLRQELVKAEQRNHQQILTAPVDGIVQQLAVHTVGGVVTPAQQLMVIVPADAGIEIEAMVANKDIGFVRDGQAAEVKIDTFNFTKYGLIPGQVIHVSRDAVVPGKAADTPADKPVQGQELQFLTRVALERAHITVDEGEVALAPGMAVTVEIKTGQRRVLDYLLSPVLRYRQEGFRER